MLDQSGSQSSSSLLARQNEWKTPQTSGTTTERLRLFNCRESGRPTDGASCQAVIVRTMFHQGYRDQASLESLPIGNVVATE